MQPEDQPSRYLEDHYLQIEENAYVGKWIMFVDRTVKDQEGRTRQDRAWKKIKQAKNQGLIWKAISSTRAAHDSGSWRDPKGMIGVYTRDYRDLLDVYIQAKRLKQILGEEFEDVDLFYKTEETVKEERSSLDSPIKMDSNPKAIYWYKRYGVLEKRVGTMQWSEIDTDDLFDEIN